MKTFEEYIQITDNDDDMTLNAKLKFNKLKQSEKLIFIDYVEDMNYTHLAKKYGVTTPTIKKYINKIKNKLTKKIW